MSRLELLSSRSIMFSSYDELDFRYINIRKIDTQNLLDKELLERVVTSVFYVDDILRSGGGAPYRVQVTHGPYLLNYIDSDSFILSGKDYAMRVFDDWAKPFSEDLKIPPKLFQIIGDLKREIFVDGRVFYSLKEITRDDKVEHAYGSSIGACGYYEYIIVDQNASLAWIFSFTDDQILALLKLLTGIGDYLVWDVLK